MKLTTVSARISMLASLVTGVAGAATLTMACGGTPPSDGNVAASNDALQGKGGGGGVSGGSSSAGTGGVPGPSDPGGPQCFGFGGGFAGGGGGGPQCTDIDVLKKSALETCSLNNATLTAFTVGTTGCANGGASSFSATCCTTTPPTPTDCFSGTLHSDVCREDTFLRRAAGGACRGVGYELTSFSLGSPCSDPNHCDAKGASNEAKYTCCSSVTPPPPEPPSPEPGPCVVGGCSGEICSDTPVASACLWNDRFACYPKYGVCERNAKGVCAWRDSKELASCLANP